MKRINPKAIAAGLATDILGSIAVGLVLSALMLFIAKHSGGITPENLKSIQSNLLLKIIGLLGTTFFTALGGYIATKLSNQSSVINSFAVGLLSLILSVALALLAPNVSPTWKVIMGLIVTIPAAIIGGRFACRSLGLTHPSSGTGENFLR